ncbi:hypothetical protein ACFQX7_10240 [Luedemannella flava]
MGERGTADAVPGRRVLPVRRRLPPGSFALRADGTWTSGKTRVRAGAKSARLVRVADNAQVARSGWPRRVVSGVAVEVYTRVDTDRHLATVPLGADGTFAADGIDAGAGG